MIDALTAQQVESFDADGFLIVEEGLVPADALALLRERFLRLFDGDYETGIKPDEVNWVRGATRRIGRDRSATGGAGTTSLRRRCCRSGRGG